MWPDCAWPEQVAGAADLEVAHRDLEPGAELGELTDRLQPLVRLLGEHAVGRVQEVRVRALTAAADAAAQLVELREAEQVGTVDDERVHRRHVDAALDDRGAHEHVELVLPEVHHDPLEAGLVHLPVRDRDARLRDQRAHLFGDELDVAHTVVHVEHLALAEQLPPDGLGDRAVVVLADVGEDGLAVFRRRVDEREVADAGERQLERARDRRGREREHVDVGAQLLDELLVRHAEAAAPRRRPAGRGLWA